MKIYIEHAERSGGGINGITEKKVTKHVKGVSSCTRCVLKTFNISPDGVIDLMGYLCSNHPHA